jgi:signal transduction histidine kinase
MRGRSKAGLVKARRRKPAAPKRPGGTAAARPGSSSAAGQESEVARLAHDLNDALERETAASEILNIISSAQASSVQPVLDTVVSNAARLCRALNATIYLREGDAVVIHAQHGPPGLSPVGTRRPINRDSVTGAAALDGQTIQVPDLLNTNDYPAGRELARQLGHRTTLAVPLLRDKAAIGVIVATRREVHPFSKTQIALLQSFAAQAVIAIENARLLNELRQSLEQQTATADVLKVISSSPGDLEPVFQSMLVKAVQICEAKFGVLFRCYHDSEFHAVAWVGVTPEYEESLRERQSFRPDADAPLGRLLLTKELIHTADELAEKSGSPAAKYGGARSLIAVPMRKQNELVGALVIYRTEVRPFTDKQIELVRNFAAQAVIAIENARLLNELRQRTAALTEALEQQTATAEVLRVISSSPGELEQVFQTILENATRICEAKYGNLYLYADGAIQTVASHSISADLAAERLRAPPFRPGPGTAVGSVIQTKAAVNIPDVLADPGYPRDDPLRRAAERGGVRTILSVPMLKESELVGAITIVRQEVRPFTEKQIQLVTNFAAQAVIAIENTRLLNELRESLDQQSATADVLKVISRSTFDLRAVLQTLVESAARFCAADNATVIREKDGLFYTAEAYGYSRGFLDYIRNTPIKPERGSASGRALVESRVVHIPDVRADPEYTFIEAPRLGDFRTALSVPILREGVSVGVLTLTRSQVKPFTDKQIELVTTFADQAAIAIENVHLFDEIQDKSRQLEVASQHKSQFLANMSHELRTPLNAILGYTELMADGAYGEPSEKMLGILKRLEANGKHLLGLINDVLDLSKIEAGQLVLELSDYCIQDIAQTVRSTLEPLASDKKLAFRVEMTPELPPGRGDGRRLTQVLINLVGNAIKFTDAGEVAVKAEAHNGSFHVSVRDTGPGISSADQARLFQEFQQADNAITKKKGGTGLGLAISKRIIEMHGGRIWVESQPGQGSIFAFTLPVIVERQVEAA